MLKAFQILNTEGSKAFGHLLVAGFHFLDGTTAVFNKLSPLFVWASKGFEIWLYRLEDGRIVLKALKR